MAESEIQIENMGFPPMRKKLATDINYFMRHVVMESSEPTNCGTHQIGECPLYVLCTTIFITMGHSR